MIVNMSEKATEQEINHVIERIREAGYQPHITRGTERTIVAAVGSGRRHEIEALQVAPGVDNVVAIAQPFKLVSRQVKPERTVVNIGGVAIGGPEVVVMAGPCSVESRTQLLDTAHAVKRAGATIVGKTTTTAFAANDPTATVNPHNHGHTPGGSSSGSAASVGGGMIPLALGTQTGGSVIRPASFCGAAAIKPSYRLLPTVGVKCFSWTLDTVGLFAADVDRYVLQRMLGAVVDVDIAAGEHRILNGYFSHCLALRAIVRQRVRGMHTATGLEVQTPIGGGNAAGTTGTALPILSSGFLHCLVSWTAHTGSAGVSRIDRSRNRPCGDSSAR